MKNIIILILIVVLGVSLYANFNSKKTQYNPDIAIKTIDKNDAEVRPSWPKISLTAIANYEAGHLTGGNSQYFDLTFTSDTDIGTASVVFTQSSSALVPNPVPKISETQKNIVIKKGATKIETMLFAQITKVTVNGKSIPFTQTY